MCLPESLVFLLLPLLGRCTEPLPTLDQKWAAFKQVFNKQYAVGEEAERRAAFEANLRMINEHNLIHDLDGKTYRLGVNKFTDMTAHDLARGFGESFLFSEVPGALPQPADEPNVLPDSIDWRQKKAVTPVKSMGVCDATYAFSVAGALESHYFIRNGKLVPLSEQAIIDCTVIAGNRGCYGGRVDIAYMFIMLNGGLPSQEQYPFAGKRNECTVRNHTFVGAIDGVVRVGPSDEDLKRAVAVGPVSVAINARDPGFWAYKHGIYNGTLDGTEVNYFVLVVGYGSEKGQDYWILKNSVGPDWGESGYMRYIRNDRPTSSLTQLATYPIVAYLEPRHKPTTRP